MKKAKELQLSEYPREKYHGYWEKVPTPDGKVLARVYHRQHGLIQEGLFDNSEAADQDIRRLMNQTKKEA